MPMATRLGAAAVLKPNGISMPACRLPTIQPSPAKAGTRLRAGLLLIAVALAGCASPPEGVLTPVAQSAPDATEVSILVATTRAPSDNPGLLYSGERGDAVDFNELVVSIPPEATRKVGEVQWPRKLPADPSREFATLSASQLTTFDQVDAWYRRNKSPTGRLLIFVHGFNTRYESAVYRFAQIAHDSGTDATPVMFTWPSRGTVFDYGYDKESTNYSRSALEALLRGAADAPDIKEVTILAHSMGTWLTMESLRQMAIRHDGVPSKISNVILASPDLDVDVFRQQLADMGPKRPKFTVFVSKDDRALTLSRRISGNVDRLGQVDITNGKFVFSCTEAYRVRNGVIGEAVKGATLIGDGATALQKIRGLGNDMALDPGMGNCGKQGQWVPVGVGQPSVLMGGLTVGGSAT